MNNEKKLSFYSETLNTQRCLTKVVKLSSVCVGCVSVSKQISAQNGGYSYRLLFLLRRPEFKLKRVRREINNRASLFVLFPV